MYIADLFFQGMKNISMDSPSYRTLESILQQKNPSTRFLQVKERELKASIEQNQPNPTVPPINVEKSGRPPSTFRWFFCSIIENLLIFRSSTIG